MLVRDILKRENNNLEILRLIAASTVIVGHSRGISGSSTSFDLIAAIFPYDYYGSAAVKFFFLLSGLVVTNSLLLNANLRRFLIARIARIFPALAVVIFLSAYVIGPLLTTEPVHNYFTNHITTSYVYRNILLLPEFNLPGVFESAPIHTMNGAIWTIPIEFLCYTVLAIIGGVGLTKNRAAFSLIIAAISVTVLLDPAALDSFDVSREASSMIVFFSIGALLATWKDKVSIRLEVVVAMALAAYVFRHTAAFTYIAFSAIFGAAILASTSRVALQIKFPGDFSYGTYLAGWPIQQLVHTAFPNMGAAGNWQVSVPLAIGFGALSWYVIEKPALQLGKRLGQSRIGIESIKTAKI